MVDLDGWTAFAGLRAAQRAARSGADRPFVRAKGDEFEQLADGSPEAYAKWPTGSYLDLVSGEEPAGHRHSGAACRGRRRRQQAELGKCLRLEFSVAPQAAGGSLASTGLLDRSIRRGRWRAN